MASADHRRSSASSGPGVAARARWPGRSPHSGFVVPAADQGQRDQPDRLLRARAGSVNFHRRLLDKAGVRTLDTDPEALAPARSARRRIPLSGPSCASGWTKEFAEHPRLVIKDPRMVWFHDLWLAVAPQVDVEPKFVIMLRHPAEVSSEPSASTTTSARCRGSPGGSTSR